MAKLRINNQLVETSEEELKKLAEQKGSPTATSPATAAAQGASPDASKMAGSRQQRFTNVQSDKQTLQQADRQNQGRQQQTQSERQVAAQAGNLQALEGLDQRVQALVNTQFAGTSNSQPTGPVFNQEALDTLQVEDKDGLTTLLTQYHSLVSTPEESRQEGHQAAVNQALADLKNKYGIANPDAYIDTDESVVADQAASAIIDPKDVTLENLDLTELGYSEEQLAELLGPEYSKMSLNDLSRFLEDARAQEFSRVESIRAQLRSAPPGSAQQQMLMQQLRDLGQVGVTGLEQGVDQLQEQVDGSEQVQFGGKNYSVENLLKDETISQIVSDYFSETADPEWKEKLKAENSKFVDWLEKNSAGLKKLADDMTTSQSGFATIQEDQAALATVGDKTLSDAVMKQLVPGWGEAVSSVADLTNNGVYQAALSDPTIVNKINTNPDLVGQLDGMTPDQVLAASAAGDELLKDPDLAAIIGAEGADFITDTAILEKIEQFKPLVSKLRESGGELSSFLAEPELQELISSGALTMENIDDLIANPERYQEWKTYQGYLEEFEDLEAGGDLDSIISFLFDQPGLDVDALNDTYDSLKYAAQDPTDKDAVARYKALQALDSNGDGRIDKKDKAGFLDLLRSGLGEVTFDKALDGTDIDFGIRDALADSVKPGVIARSPFMETVEASLGPKGKLSYEEILKLPADIRKKAMKMPQEWKDKYMNPKFDTEKEMKTYAGVLKQREEKETTISEINSFAYGQPRLHTSRVFATHFSQLDQTDLDAINAMLGPFGAYINDPDTDKDSVKYQEMKKYYDRIRSLKDANEQHRKYTALLAEAEKQISKWRQLGYAGQLSTWEKKAEEYRKELSKYG